MALGIRKNKILDLFKPFTQTFSYTGGVQSVTIPYKGLYQLEVWGAQGGSVKTGTGGKGGYSTGYVLLNEGDVLYIVVGGAGGSTTSGDKKGAGGYNGGGYGYQNNKNEYSGYLGGTGGGGATHIAKVTGILKDIGKTSFVTNGNGYIVAGGGGGGGKDDQWYSGSQGSGYPGGTGGGTTGGDGTYGHGGTQTSGGSGKSYGSFGQGGQTSSDKSSPGGGGGFYGGGGGEYYYSGGGGSGWVGGVPAITYKGTTYNPSMSNGQRNGSGQAIITRIA